MVIARAIERLDTFKRESKKQMLMKSKDLIDCLVSPVAQRCPAPKRSVTFFEREATLSLDFKASLLRALDLRGTKVRYGLQGIQNVS